MPDRVILVFIGNTFGRVNARPLRFAFLASAASITIVTNPRHSNETEHHSSIFWIQAIRDAIYLELAVLCPRESVKLIGFSEAYA